MQDSAASLYILDPAKLEAFEIGAWLMAILAFPGPDEAAGRREAAEAWGADAVRVSCAADPSRIQEFHDHFPVYAAIDIREQKRRLRTFSGRLRRRMVAARMSLGFLEEAITGERAKLPAGMANMSLDALCRLVQRQTSESDPQNLEHRVWRSSRPVIHLAAAVQIVLRHMSLEPGAEVVNYPMGNNTAHQIVIHIAQYFEAFVLKDPRLGVRPVGRVGPRLPPHHDIAGGVDGLDFGEALGRLVLAQRLLGHAKRVFDRRMFVPFARLVFGEPGRRRTVQPTFRGHDVGVRLRLAIRAHGNMDRYVRDHAPTDQFLFDELADQRDHLVMAELTGKACPSGLLRYHPPFSLEVCARQAP